MKSGMIFSVGLLLVSAGGVIGMNGCQCNKMNASVCAPAGEKSEAQTAHTQLRVGIMQEKEFSIVLESNPTTGYKWELLSPLNDNIVQLVKSDFVPAPGGCMGGGGKDIWTFKAVNKGTTNVSFKYIRPWEKDSVPVKEETFTVVVE